jgi:hypothetical protein
MIRRFICESGDREESFGGPRGSNFPPAAQIWASAQTILLSNQPQSLSNGAPIRPIQASVSRPSHKIAQYAVVQFTLNHYSLLSLPVYLIVHRRPLSISQLRESKCVVAV